MCGINGVLFFKKTPLNEEMSAIISAMNNQIIHRGPDDQGVYIKENIAFGMRRLSVIDPETGKQPVYSMDRTIAIVFNGEIYNYRALRNKLLDKGYTFQTRSDTEVIANLYQEYKEEAFAMLKGMFSIAIHDSGNKTVFLVRDRVGEKPLYYTNDSERFIFASELKSIIKTGLLKKEINMTALKQYLRLTYIPAPLSILKGVHKLLPGHYLQIDEQGNRVEKRYWDLKYSKSNRILNYDECKKALRQEIFSAVENMLVSDVPVGTFLSGGIDSTIITGIASQLSQKKIDSFTIGYHNKAYDESARAKIAAAKHKVDHHIFYVEPEDFLQAAGRIIKNIDEPFADSSYIPSYFVSNMASQKVKVVLTGDAGDEIFAGYSKYLIGYYSQKYDCLPLWVKTMTRKTIYFLPESSFTKKAKKVLYNMDKPIFEQRRNLMCLGFKEEDMNRLLATDKSSDELRFIEKYYYSQTDSPDEISNTLYTDLKVVLEGDMLTKMDRASMLASVETRVPFLAKNVIELAAQIPSEYKIKGKEKKIILRDAFSDLIPPELYNAPKRGFAVPIGEWFRNELKEDLLSVLDEKKIFEQGVFRYEEIKKITDIHFSGKEDRTTELWILYIFQKWMEEYFETDYFRDI